MFKGERLANREGLLVSINGHWGEIAPLPGFSTETLAEAEAESLACLAALSRGEKAVPTVPTVPFGVGCAFTVLPTAPGLSCGVDPVSSNRQLASVATVSA
jgi:O-succinylbenzoate synthase